MKRKRLEDVEIRPSTLEEVDGLGLFATRDFKKGELVCRMYGDILTERQYDRLYPKGDSRYVCEVKSKEEDGITLYIDCADPRSCYARYINTLTKKQRRLYGLKFNVEYVCPPDATHFDIVAVRKIKADEELFVDYGPCYPIP